MKYGKLRTPHGGLLWVRYSTDLIASLGSSGERGEKGEPGPAGPAKQLEPGSQAAHAQTASECEHVIGWMFSS